MAAKSKTKKKAKLTVTKGKAYVQSSFNNTLISLADANGNVIAWSSSGSAGFKGTRKSTSFAAQIAAEQAAEKAKALGLKEVEVEVRGIGSGRESAVRALQHSGIQVLSIKDVTPVPHNGVRSRKPRRV